MRRLLILGMGIFSTVLSWFGFSYVQLYITHVDSYHWTIDNQLHAETQQKIIAWVENQHTTNPYAIIRQIIKEFPCIKHINISYMPNHEASIDIKAYRPFCVINGDSIVTHDHTVIPKEIYSSWALVLLPHIQIKDNEISTERIAQIAHYVCNALDYEVFEMGTFVWVNETYAYIQDKQEPRLIYVCSAERMMNHDTLHQSMKIKNSLDKQGAFAIKSRDHWIIDMRFKDQIIVSSAKGGYRDGASIFGSDSYCN